MKFLCLKRDEAKSIFTSYVNDGIPEFFEDELDDDYKKIRNDILGFEPKSESGYLYDLKFGVELYKYFNSLKGFNETIASNYDFWRYICVKVLPDIVYKRHGFVESYYYDKNVRIYIPTLWWYIHMSYQKNIDSTYETLKKFNTDYILQLVERPGREGMYLDITRKIVKYLSIIPKEKVNIKIAGANLMRRVLIQHTARINNYNLIVEDEVDEYVRELFTLCGEELDYYE